ncbi:alpha/beta hydrolase [Fulvimonas soli]|uniref:Pimeloyl-ACP methyl ester carboxylesterase n=1 Tax=Fulvimonas soli TaxID=155197 RepID=A0A316I2Z4_9GAMM|nr:alpha/beta hydrolase [Fulvimonas soli]PWK86733.1 pimeloyl-ACP methyl ester carboxylesterase [Fulvimonas soli]TNY27066.1 alpha/beta hydrolase [Fulvimonas soli]
MASKGRTAFRVAVFAVAIGALAWKQFHPSQPPAEASAATATDTPAAPAAPARPRTWRLGRLTLTACELGQPNSGLSAAAWCAPFEVAENRADPHGRRIRLKLAVVRSQAQVPAKDMLVLLAGGPGQAATETWPQVAPALQPLLAHRNVLLLDQRGTGGSNPLDCKAPDGAEGDAAFDPAKLREETAQCLKEVEARADPRYYTTTVAVQDLEEARQALGAPGLDLVGISYGTRVAQQYAMRHPDAVRSLVLDGVAPNSLVLGEDFARNLDDALKAQFARCTAEPECKARFGDPYQTLYQLRDALRANPHKVSFRDPQTYQSVQRTLSEASLASVVRMFAYSPLTAALLPLSIDAAAHGDVGPLLGQAKLLSGDLSDTMNGGMQSSVICSEDADLLAPRPQDAGTILGTRMIDALQAVCSVWPRGARPADFHRPLRSDVPALLLSGQYDPVTPPRYGEEVLEGLPNGRHLVLKGQGHNVIGAGCAPELVKHFIEDLEPKKLDASCLDRLQPAPLFIDFNGATP